MSDFADIFAQVIQKLGGRDAVQTLLGVGPSALSNYLRRAKLPRDKMAIISAALHAKGWSFEPKKLQLHPPHHPNKETGVADNHGRYCRL